MRCRQRYGFHEAYLRLVERIAEQMGAVFTRDTGEPPMTTRFSLRWPRSSSQPKARLCSRLRGLESLPAVLKLLSRMLVLFQWVWATAPPVSYSRRSVVLSLGVDPDARLSRDYTGRCRKDSTWGTRPGVLWVTNGCQGRFELVRSGGFGGSGGSGSAIDNPGQQQRAESQCRNEARRQGVDVRNVSKAKLQGSYWAATVTGQLRGQNVQGACRYYPAGNRAELRF